MIKIHLEFPENLTYIAAAFSRALADIADKDGSVSFEEDENENVDALFLHEPKKDENGVTFSEKFCSEGFYLSGQRRGQWKRAKNVSQSDYDAWYKLQLPQERVLVENEDSESEEDLTAPIATAEAFKSRSTVSLDSPAVAHNVPTSAGELLGWVSSRQAAGYLTQDDVNSAWNEAGVSLNDLFDSDADKVSLVISKIFTLLSKKVN